MNEEKIKSEYDYPVYEITRREFQEVEDSEVIEEQKEPEEMCQYYRETTQWDTEDYENATLNLMASDVPIEKSSEVLEVHESTIEICAKVVRGKISEQYNG